ncbi:MAG: hypothetical protein AB8B74_05210 [Crocinitomicaceae bacterium]
MNKFLTMILLLLLAINCHAQNKEISDFIPEGFVEFEKHFGDLNKDGQEDCVLIVKATDTNNIVINRFDKKVDRNRRGIIVLFKSENSYQLADKNYNCFSSENEDGGVYFPPDLWIEFQKGNLVVHFGHGRYGFWRYVFRYQEACFKLIGFDSSSNRGPIILKETSINFLTKKKLIRENTNEDVEPGEEVFQETWIDIEIENLIHLSEIVDIDELNVYDY